MDIFLEVSFIIVIATVLSFFMRFLKQPLIVGYILTGILTGPLFLNILKSTAVIELFSKIGITILLFIVGLSLNPRVIKEVGKVSFITGVGQVLLTSIIGFLIALILGLDRIAALYIAIALTFSSTIIVLKLLSDKGDIHKLYGKIAIGFLIVQDIIAAIILIIVSSLQGTGSQDTFSLISSVLARGGFLILFLIVIAMHILPRVARFAAYSQELLFLLAISWGLGLSSVFHMLGFSVEIGALVAGVTFTTTPYAYEIGARVKPLRDFFAVLFFILLGSQIAVDSLGELIFPALFLSAFVLIGNPIIFMVIMNLLGYGRRTAFLTGLTVAQISEFSLILAALGFQLGHINEEIVSLITLVGLITIAGSTYLILHADVIYKRISHLLGILELKKVKADVMDKKSQDYHMLLFGYDRMGSYILDSFSKTKKNFLVVDFNPEIVEKLNRNGIPALYGDAQDPHFLHELNIKHLRLIVSTIPDFKTNSQLAEIVSKNPHAIFITVSHDSREAIKLYEKGATHVIVPRHLGNLYVSSLINQLGLEKKAHLERGAIHLKRLRRLHERLP